MDISGINSIADVGQLSSQMTLDRSVRAERSFQSVLDQVLNEEDDAEIKKACQEFESFFIYKMLQQMRRTIPESTIIPKSYATRLYEDLLDDERAKQFAGLGGIGLADMMYKQIKRENAYKTSQLFASEFVANGERKIEDED